MPVTGLRRAMRIIVTLEGEVLPSLVEYFLAPGGQGASQSWQDKVAHAVGLLYDYTVAKPPTAAQVKHRSYLSQFVADMYSGTCERDGADASGLYWPAATREKVITTLRLLNEFTSFCARAYRTEELNPLRPATFKERMAALRALETRNENSMFLHLKNARALLDGKVEAISEADPNLARTVTARRNHTTRVRSVSAFPDDAALRLFVEGFRVKEGKGWDAYNVRDLMISLLLRQAGLRVSEPFHLFVRDVMQDPDRPGHAKVLLYHPEDGLAAYIDPLTRRAVGTTRANWLNKEWGGRVPRNRMLGSSEYVGWKDLLLEEDKPHYYANVYWIDEGTEDGTAVLFWSLYLHYISRVRPTDTDHPYLFCTHHGRDAGAPYKYDAFTERAFPTAVKRLGLAHGKRLGTTPHGLRHAYAQDLRRKLAHEPADLRTAVIQCCLHHKSPDSQRVYTKPRLQEINAVLTNASARLNSGALALPGISSALAGYFNSASAE